MYAFPYFPFRTNKLNLHSQLQFPLPRKYSENTPPSAPMEPSTVLFPFLLCLLSSTTATVIRPAAPSTALLAADALQSRGYSIFSSLLISISTLSTNFSGTLFAPPDLSFSPAAAAPPTFFNNHRPAPPRPSSSLLLYHTLKPTLSLSWLSISSGVAGDQLPTFYDNNCLFVRRNPHAGTVTVSSSPLNNRPEAVTVRQPDLYVDDQLVVHGIDGVLDPAFAVKCGAARGTNTPTTTVAGPRLANRTFVDRAIRSLRVRGYNVVATAMEITRSELLSLRSVTVFAVSDKDLFLFPNGFHYNFRHHVVPMRNRITDLAGAGTELLTLAPNKTVRITTVDGNVHIDGVETGEEVYSNRRMSVISVKRSLDDDDDDFESQWSRPTDATGAVSDNLVFTPISFPDAPPSFNFPPVPAPLQAPVKFGEGVMGFAGTDEALGNYASNFATETGNSPMSPNQHASKNLASFPTPSRATDDMVGVLCDMAAAEGDVNNCAVGGGRKLREREGHVESSKPLDGKLQDLVPKPKLADFGNIADDLFFYI